MHNPCRVPSQAKSGRMPPMGFFFSPPRTSRVERFNLPAFRHPVLSIPRLDSSTCTDGSSVELPVIHSFPLSWSHRHRQRFPVPSPPFSPLPLTMDAAHERRTAAQAAVKAYTDAFPDLAPPISASEVQALPPERVVMEKC
ncbi:hypothetical protein Naga_101920g1 [Nannochloropsis gaditana]|uniref:Uncharacterized protein n=1 Tax=Nannochloropsis gaditana TaxID=72520 RepID=W7SYZ6_9STRA|nr:hypothetical protein Naga_101920g1 [Nannochloropsis gaditana]